MKLIIFGATGGTGRHLVDQALDLGHSVTAFVRDRRRLGTSHDNLHIVEGDILAPAAVERAVAGHDGVLCALGMPLMNADKLRTAGTRNIVCAMENAGVERIVCLSSMGVGDSREFLPLHYRAVILPLLLRRVVADHSGQERLLRDSSLDWTIVRPGNLTDGPVTDESRHDVAAPSGSIKIKVSRADVAAFMLKQVNDNGYSRQAPYLTY